MMSLFTLSTMATMMIAAGSTSSWFPKNKPWIIISHVYNHSYNMNDRTIELDTYSIMNKGLKTAMFSAKKMSNF